MARTIPTVAVCWVCLFASPAQALWMRSESLEWWTNVSDLVAVAEVADTKRIGPLDGDLRSQEVRCVSTATLKGDRIDSFVFRQDYRDKELASCTDAAALRPKTRVLLFGVRAAGARTTEVIFWVNLTEPDANLSTHAPYNNDCKWLEDGTSVLALVKARVARENPQDRTKRRGVIVPFTAYQGGDMYWDFVRTADPDYKPELVKQLRNGDRESAIYNLISYPGQDTRDLIRPFLKDASVRESQVNDGNYTSGSARMKTVKIYPLRQAAYAALVLLGEPTEKPEGYDPDPFLWLFEVGFERRSHFPYGDWKRYEK